MDIIPTRCLDCDVGRFELVVRDYIHERPDGSSVTVPRVNFLRCVECGEETLTNESNDYLLSFGAGPQEPTPIGASWNNLAMPGESS